MIHPMFRKHGDNCDNSYIHNSFTIVELQNLLKKIMDFVLKKTCQRHDYKPYCICNIKELNFIIFELFIFSFRTLLISKI